LAAPPPTGVRVLAAELADEVDAVGGGLRVVDERALVGAVVAAGAPEPLLLPSAS